jgi:hypothetical protein
VSKATRRAIANTEKPIDSDSPIMVIGDKSKMQLSRVLAKNLAMSFNQIGRDIPTFADAAGVADLIVKSDVKYDGISIVYNKFVSAVSYEPEIVEVAGENALKESGTITCSQVLFCNSYTSSWIPGIRNGGRRYKGPCRVLACKRYLCCSCRGSRMRAECPVR